MKIAYNPKTAAVITAATAVNDDILFDLNARKVWAKGLRMGADWADISSKPSSLKNPAAIKFRDINGTEVSYDGSVAKDLTTGTYIARLPYGFSSFDSKPTWGSTTGTSIACWKDASGGSIDFRKDNPTSGKLSIKVDGRVYVNEGTNPVLSSKYGSGFWGMRTPDGGNDWIRTSNNGLLPCINGNAGSGHSSLGTNSWYFSTAYIDKVYGSLKGNADTATTATTALKADKLTNARNIALGTDLRGSANFDGSGNITINATINSCLVSVGGTDKLHFKRIAHFETGNSYNDNALLLYISQGYINGNNGICRIEFRTDNISQNSTSITASAAVRWLVRNGYGLDSLYAGYYVTTGKAYIDIYLKTTGGYQGTVIRVLQDSRGSINSNVQLISAKYNSDTDYKEAYSSIEAAATTLYNRAYTRIVSGGDVGVVNYANSTGSATKLQTARNLWGNSFNGTKDINDSIVFPAIGDAATSSKISWSGASDGADIYYQTTAKDQGNLVLNVKDDANAYIQLALNGVFKSHFDVANSYWTGRSALADKWTTARTFTIGNTAKDVDGSGNVSWTLAEIGVRDTWRTVQVNGTSIGNNTLNLCNSTYIGLTNVNGKVTFSLVGSSTTANQAILSNGTANGWTLKTLNIANWDTAYNLRHSHANKSVLDGITTGLVTNWNTAYTFVSTITGTDTDNVINKWEEIVNFLAGITEDNKLNTLLGSKLSIQQLSAKDILTTKTNNALFWVNTTGTAGSITTGPFTDHPYALLSVTNYSQNDTNGKFFYRSRLAFSSAGDIKVASCHHQNEYKQDDAWYNVLTSKNSGISGSTIKLNGSSITVYSSDTADGRYVKKSGDTMTGTLTINTSGFGALHITRNDDANAAAIQFRGKSSVYGYIGLNSTSKDKQFLRYSSDISKVYTILDTSSTNVTDGKGVINGTTITQVDNSTNADKLDGYHAGGLLSALSNSNRGISLTVGGTTKSLSNISVGDADTVDHYHISDESRQIYKYEYTVDNPAGAWILIKLPAYNAYNEIVTIDGHGNNRFSYCIVHCGSRNQGIWGYQSEYNGITVNKIRWIGGDNSGKYAIVALIDGDITTLKIRATNSLEISKTTEDTKAFTITANFFSIGGSFYGRADSATKVGVTQHTTNDSNYPLVWSNQSNTGNATENQLFKSWQDLYYNPKNKRLTVAGSVSTVYVSTSKTVSSKGFIHTSVTENANQYVLTADGGYTFFNQTSNELAHEFSVSIAVTEEWKDIPGFYGGSQTFLTQPGTYVIQVYYKSNSSSGMYEGYFSGIMSWYTKTTNSNNADEIVLHRVGHAYSNTIYLRTKESLGTDTNPYTKLQISANSKLTEHTYTFKFKRIC